MGIRRIARKIWEVFWLFAHGEVTVACRTIFEWIYSESICIGLVRDLSSSHQPVLSNLSIRIKPIAEEDFDILFHSENAVGIEVRTLASFEGFLNQRIGSCYVATTEEGKPCYFASLITYKENAAQQDYFRGLLPDLETGEALIENIYTVAEFRRKGIHGLATYLICEEAKEIGVERVLIYIDCENVGSLKGAKRAGFQPYDLRVDRWYMFFRSVKFMQLDGANLLADECKEALSYFE